MQHLYLALFRRTSLYGLQTTGATVIERLTQIASAITVTVYGLDSKKLATYELSDRHGGFADVCNTLDHLRNANLRSQEEIEEAKKEAEKPKKKVSA